MGYFTTIYIVAIEFPDQSLVQRSWFWDDTEGKDMYQSAVDEVGDSRIVTLYSIDIQGQINELVDGLMANRHSRTTVSPLQELRSSRPAPEGEDVTWGELRFDPDGSFYVERLKASTSEYWPYTVEPYAETRPEGGQVWRVLDATTATPIAIIRPHTVGTNAAFKVVVNGYSQTQAFNDLKSAVIYAAEEYNGV